MSRAGLGQFAAFAGYVRPQRLVVRELLGRIEDERRQVAVVRDGHGDAGKPGLERVGFDRIDGDIEGEMRDDTELQEVGRQAKNVNLQIEALRTLALPWPRGVR